MESSRKDNNKYITCLIDVGAEIVLIPFPMCVVLKLKKKNRKNITNFYKNSYRAYFVMPLDDLDKKWAPQYVCCL